MYAFAYWHTYYDSAFLNYPLKISPALYYDLQITVGNVSKWPISNQLSQLSRLFQLLENYIIDNRNWIGCHCNQTEMENIQQKLNLMIVNLQCQKKYGSCFWEKSRRRIQASVLHFYLFLQMLIYNIIPEDCQNLLQACRQEKLPTELFRLQGLVNDILQLFKSIHDFMFHPFFGEQIQLTKEFFHQFSIFTQTMPKIKRSKIMKIPNLMKYICICNPLETSVDDQSGLRNFIRKKNATVFEKPIYKRKVGSEQKPQHHRKIKIINNSIIKTKINKESLQKNKNGNQIKSNKDILQQLQFFKFNDMVRKHSFYIQTKKPTATTIETKQKTASIDKSRSPSHDRSTLGYDTIKLKSMTVTESRPKQQTIFQERRSRQISSKSIQSRKKRSLMRGEIYDAEQIQHQRDDKLKKKKVSKLSVKTNKYSQQMNLSNGKSNGWGVIRQWMNNKIAQRKLRKLLLLL